MRLKPVQRAATLAAMLALATLGIAGCCATPESRFPARGHSLDWIRVSDDGTGFEQASTGEPFRPWGFNYDHDRHGRLIEDYWIEEWDVVEEDFHEMKSLGANVVRVHLQFGRFMNGPDRPNLSSLRQLDRLLRLAERTGLYLDLTGLGCYHKDDVPPWYDALAESDRWRAQAAFWEAVARTCRHSPAVFCYDLMNEPVAPGGNRPREDWLGPAFAGKHFVQFISLDRAERDRTDIARSWIETLTAAIRRHDTRRLVTVGLVHWSLDRPGLTSGFVPESIRDTIDFISVHLYPRAGQWEEDLDTLRGFQVGKPVVVEETFPLHCGIVEFREFFEAARALSVGWMGFYWGATPEELRGSGTIQDALMLQWLEFFTPLGPTCRFGAESARLPYFKVQRSTFSVQRSGSWPHLTSNYRGPASL